MNHDTDDVRGQLAPDAPGTDWAELRARAAKDGISLSELQQRDREKQARLARKTQQRNRSKG
jgi:hypothetical protein